MANKPEELAASLVKLYKEESRGRETEDLDSKGGEKEDSEQEDLPVSGERDEFRVLRDGSSHPRLPRLTYPLPGTLPKHASNMATSAPSTSGASPPGPAPIKILPTATTVPEYSGIDLQYPALEFINLCEAVMTNTFIHGGHDKISFVRSRLTPGSPAMQSMQATAFLKPFEDGDYVTFRRHFLQTFGDDGEGSFVKGMTTLVEKTLTTNSLHDWRSGQIEGQRFSKACKNLAQVKGWINNDTVSSANFVKFCEFFGFLISLKPKHRKIGQTLLYEDADDLHGFAQRLKTKISERDSEDRTSASVRAVTTSSSASDPKPQPQNANEGGSNKKAPSCTYCRRDGHTNGRCYKRIRDQKLGDASKTSGAASLASGQYNPKKTGLEETATGRRPQTTGTAAGSASDTRTTRPYCSIHESYSHSTDECYMVTKWRDNVKRARALGGKSSGEDARTPKDRPR